MRIEEWTALDRILYEHGKAAWEKVGVRLEISRVQTDGLLECKLHVCTVLVTRPYIGIYTYCVSQLTAFLFKSQT